MNNTDDGYLCPKISCSAILTAHSLIIFYLYFVLRCSLFIRRPLKFHVCRFWFYIFKSYEHNWAPRFLCLAFWTWNGFLAGGDSWKGHSMANSNETCFTKPVAKSRLWPIFRHFKDDFYLKYNSKDYLWYFHTNNYLQLWLFCPDYLNLLVLSVFGF